MKKLTRRVGASSLAHVASWALALGLVALIAFDVAKAIRVFTSNPAALSLPEAPARATDRQSIKSPLQNYQMFGSIERAGEEADKVPVQENVPETNLTLSLLGIIAGIDGQLSGAIVTDDKGNTGYFRVGETLPGDAELIRVEPDRIFLRRNGQYEALSFEGRDEDGKKRPAIAEPVKQPDSNVKTTDTNHPAELG
ncbi:type II secretion system protein N [Marinobacter oulmenensis]|uniref:Type II secretion system protein C n=1 Tax=Marinobacter oulmenensis TaxID=643747 RepID=A0A840UGJ7_9GAMM|nr:type II secretion system protein N [Marinobacter oulmenensis]MBB5321851.1 type II secretion system protein C [Marinobacter oulmenensis]